MRTKRLYLALFVLLPVACESKPQAPALSRDPIYVDTTHGFRLIAPDGWTQLSRAEIPAGPLDKERVLVSYHLTGNAGLAVLEVQLADLPPDRDAAAWLQREASHSVKKWKLAAPGEAVQLGGQSATHYTLQSDPDRRVTKEVYIVRGQGDRVTLFVGIYGTKEKKIRDQIRQSLQQVRF